MPTSFLGSFVRVRGEGLRGLSKHLLSTTVRGRDGGIHMNIRNWFGGLAAILLFVPAALAVTQTEKVRNDKVLVVEQTLAPGDAVSLSTDRPGVLVYLNDGRIEATPVGRKLRTEAVKRGEAVFQPSRSGVVKNVGSSELRIVSVEYLDKGALET